MRTRARSTFALLFALGGCENQSRERPRDPFHHVAHTKWPPVEERACPLTMLDAEDTDCPAGPSCNFPEGECRCEYRDRSDWNADPATASSRPHVWRCRPNNTAMLRKDGCPFGFGAPGAACSEKGKTCVYPPDPPFRLSMICDPALEIWIARQENVE